MTSLDFNSRTTGTLGGDCFAEPAPAPAPVSLTVAASSLGITPGNGLYNSQQADAAPPSHTTWGAGLSKGKTERGRRGAAPLDRQEGET